MSNDVYRKVGRGGAGNFIQPKQADEASRDLEAQRLDQAQAPSSDRPAAPAAANGPALSRAGRGGAGNYVDAASARQHEQQAAEVTAAAVAGASSKQQQQGQHRPVPHPRLGGRGGAGNWQDSAAAEEDERRRLEDEQRKVEELDRMALEEVDKGLKMPERVHHGQESRKANVSTSVAP